MKVVTDWQRMLLENFELIFGSMPKNMKVLMRKDFQQSSCLDSQWHWRVRTESVAPHSENHPKLSYKQLRRDMEKLMRLMERKTQRSVSWCCTRCCAVCEKREVTSVRNDMTSIATMKLAREIDESTLDVTKTVVQRMEDGDFHSHERPVSVLEACDVRIESIGWIGNRDSKRESGDIVRILQQLKDVYFGDVRCLRTSG